ncbi:MAG TPA: glutathione binding-like protein [Candidatus Binataceae bacterium]|nr:glutathione binding-like protein [Candidatus Binataceae bacterium]
MYKILFQMRKPEAERDHAKIEEGERETCRHFEYLNRELAGREFIAGQFSLADIAYMPHLSSYERAGYAVPSDLTDLHAWWERLKTRPSYAKSWPS